MNRTSEPHPSRSRDLVVIRPLFAAGFVTAFGAHSIAATLGNSAEGLSTHLFTLGVLLALYDGAEVLLKPVFGSLADRIGPRPVLLGGLLGFALASAGFVLAGDPAWLGVARFAQGAAAAAFSPAAGAMIARIAPDRRRGRAFGSYGAWKGLGYTLGPLLGGVLISVGRLPAAVRRAHRPGPGRGRLGRTHGAPPGPAAPNPADRDRPRPPAHRPRVPGPDRRAGRQYRRPVQWGRLPARPRPPGRTGPGGHRRRGVGAGRYRRAHPAVDRPSPGRRAPDRSHRGRPRPARHRHRARHPRRGPASLVGLLGAAVLIGVGTGLITPLAFAALAAGSPPERLGQTMGAAEIGRELGDAGGPLLVGALATAAGLATGFLGLAAALALTAAAVTVTRPPPARHP